MNKKAMLSQPMANKTEEEIVATYFCKGWESARGCKLEHAVAEAYGVKIIYEED